MRTRIYKTFAQGVEAAKDEIANGPDYTNLARLCQAIGSFADDPPDTPFQSGYLQGLFDVLRERLAR